MAQTFDIRFARSAGFAALLEVPENAFRWKGGGLLRIDAQSISFTLKRGLLAFFSGKRTRRIPAENLKAVYREGEALRVEFQIDETARMVLPFWAGDRDIAAQIVRLLPTSQTVEIEHSTDATRSGKPRADRRVLLIIGVALAALPAGIWALYPRTGLPVAAPLPASDRLPMPDASASLVETDNNPLPAASGVPAVETPQPTSEAVRSEPSAIPDFLEPPPVVLPAPGSLPLPRDYVRSEDFVIPIARGTAAFDIAKRELAAFQLDATALETAYRSVRNDLNAGALTPESFAARLDDLEMRWWDATFRIFDNEALAAPALLDLRAAMLASARLWRSFLSGYALGIRERDHVKIARSFDELARAEEMQSRARLFLR
jgi:hypothetical protein